MQRKKTWFLLKMSTGSDVRKLGRSDYLEAEFK